MTKQNEDAAELEEQAIDALLDEVVGNAAPPELTREILQQLRAQPVEAAPIVCTDQPVATKRDSSTRKQITLMAALVASLAASLMLAVWLRSDRDPQEIAIAESGVDPDALESQFPMARPSDQVDAPSPTTIATESTRGIPLVEPSSTTPVDPPQLVEQIVEAPRARPQAPIKAVTLVSKQVDSQLRRYWGQIGIAPSPAADSDAIVARLATVLGVQLPADAVGDPQRLQQEFAKGPASEQIAGRWLEQISQRGLLRVPQQSRQQLINDLAGCFQSQRQFDQTLASWISQQSPNSPAFYSALASGARDVGNSSAMVRRMASLTMDVDLRCIRCHDSHIVGDGRQQDYWAFAAFLRRGLASEPTKIPPLFYDLPDGRRRIAEPGVAPKWMRTSAHQIGSLRQWSQRLIGSQELARGVVNSLWQLVHGQPLRGRVVDPISAPHHAALDRLEDELAQDLAASQFDVARMLAMIVASPVTQRAVPQPLLPENALVADEAQMRVAMDAVDAFAAALPTRPRSGMNSRLDEAMRAIGMRLDADGQSIVAQIGDDAKAANGTASSKSLSVDFPYRAEALPVQWLSSIEDQQSQVEHLGYLAGIDRLPARIAQSAKSMRAAGVDNELTLHRVWWMVRP